VALVSIYASLDAPDDDHTTECGVYVETSPGCFDFDEDGECTCGLLTAPIVYQGSHILPAMTDERDGHVDLALIPGHIERDGRERETPDEDTPWPYLRFGVNGETVVLDVAGVERVHASLDHWLRRVTPGVLR
jgi:hypothetical protein